MTVYLQHYGLAEAPFGLTPDTGFVFARAAHQQALATLWLALIEGEGYVQVRGEVGTGKTLLCRALLERLDAAGRRCAYLPNPALTPRQLLLALCREFDIDADDRASAGALQARLQQALLHGAGGAAVVCIDDAQAMPAPTLEALRLLSNLETARRKLLQVVFFAQPEFDALLRAPLLRSLASRIGHAVELPPLTRAEAARYLDHRLLVAGWKGAPVFGGFARWLWHRASAGVPRRLNVMAHKGLLLAYGAGRHRVGWREAWWAWRDSRRAQLGPARTWAARPSPGL
jgi:MSHA biogenesis protein MshM